MCRSRAVSMVARVVSNRRTSVYYSPLPFACSPRTTCPNMPPARFSRWVPWRTTSSFFLESSKSPSPLLIGGLISKSPGERSAPPNLAYGPDPAAVLCSVFRTRSSIGSSRQESISNSMDGFVPLRAWDSMSNPFLTRWRNHPQPSWHTSKRMQDAFRKMLCAIHSGSFPVTVTMSSFDGSSPSRFARSLWKRMATSCDTGRPVCGLGFFHRKIVEIVRSLCHNIATATHLLT